MSNMMRLICQLVLLNACIPVIAQDRGQNFICHERMLDAGAVSKNVTVTYLDGIGRPVRDVTNSLGMSGTYVSSMQLYDECGREGRKYFPVKIGGSARFLTNSEFVSSSNDYYGEHGAFEEKRHDVLNRERSYFKGGKEWLENDRKITKRYLTNEEPIKRYIFSSANGVMEKESYATGSLYVEETSDEDGNKLSVYTNGIGQKILERRAGDNDTYFVYDDLGRLRFVLSPNFQVDGDLLASAYEYKYNGRGKCIWKRLPGAQQIQCWYDRNDRLMCEQDGELRRKGLFRFYVYDGLGRLVIQGTTSTCNLSCTDASATMGNSSGFLQTGYVLNNSIASTANLEIVNYYDTYDFLQKSYLAPLGSFMRRGAPSKLPISLKTGCIQFTSQGSVVPQAFYYNERGLVEEEYSAYPNNTFVRKSYIYSFTGQVKMENVELSRGSQSYTYKILSDYCAYNDKIGRIEIILPDNTKRLISEYGYDEIGRLRNMKRGGTVGSIQFDYNTRGWLTQMHSGTFSEDLYYANTDVAAPCFNGNVSSMTWQTSNDKVLRGYSFSYDNLNRLTTSIYGEGQNLHSNANRYSEMVQRYDANGSPLALKRDGKKNDGTYGLIDDLHYAMRGNQVCSVADDAERLLYPESFDFKQTSGAAYDYDANGALVYDPNKGLRIVYDHCGYPQVLEFQNGNRTIFEYAPNGAKLSVTHQTGLSTTVSTEAEGASLAEQSTIVSKTEYVGNVIFEQGNISKILFNDGYYQFSDNLCHYFVKDHLGSVRTVVNEKGVLEQVTHYYPLGGYFGDDCYNAGLQDFKYNGKELDRMHGLMWYDYGERSYDAALDRWDRIDKLCEQYFHISPYVYCGGNPMLFIDKDGRKIEYAQGTSESFKRNFAMAVNYLKEHKVDGILAKLQNSSKIIYIAEVAEGDHSHFSQNDVTIYWDPNMGLQTNTGCILSPATILNHEADHALEYISHPKRMSENMHEDSEEYLNMEEYRVITGSEQRTAEALGEASDGKKTRTNHFGTFVTVSDPDLNFPGLPTTITISNEPDSTDNNNY